MPLGRLPFTLYIISGSSKLPPKTPPFLRSMLPLPHPYQTPDGSLVGHVLHIDGFGNLITNIKGDDLPQTKQAMTIKVGNQLIHGLSRTYAEGRGLLALIGGSGYLEVSLRGGSASTLLNTRVGNEVRIR